MSETGKYYHVNLETPQSKDDDPEGEKVGGHGKIGDPTPGQGLSEQTAQGVAADLNRRFEENGRDTRATVQENK